MPLPTLAKAFAPGRIEILGNHTDYNQGVVLSCAVPAGVTATIKATTGSNHILRTVGDSREYLIPAFEPLMPQPGAWTNYPLGVLHFLQKDEEIEFPALDFSFESNLPAGAGLSSSAAIEVATALALLALAKRALSPLPLAKLARKAENDFVGVNCGLLDQATSVGGALDHLVHLDCRPETFTTIPCPPGFAFIIVNSGVKHELVGGEYNERRERCFEAARLLGVPALRDTTTADVMAGNMPEEVRRRALHITGENERVFQAVAHLKAGRMEELGALMFDSHESSRINFENSTSHLDQLVAIAHKTPGALGARLTGGGFGGAAVILTRAADADSVGQTIASTYSKEANIQTAPVIYGPSQGARLISVESI